MSSFTSTLLSLGVEMTRPTLSVVMGGIHLIGLFLYLTFTSLSPRVHPGVTIKTTQLQILESVS